ncbi:phosphate acyltransferase PlsX [Anaerococcus sp. AGMB00486]|uniref:Phosphate acyltransferase n=2 Tax=Anaerococcus TaxID=165779 RepID=A0ABX2N8L1_9FIRM|nr:MULTISPECIES: phosphate acyltransferase PlsX [Anaerococcus]MSS77164.1 phosphate acyltransferase PlsX [Anaerococcus porci]NVF11032.1 phosphate acyltransferase PlsX [Anaerococcus faecalis]
MKIIVDTYGADDGIEIPIEGTIEALKEKDFIPVFVGDKEEIENIISQRIDIYEIIDAKDRIDNNEDPVRAIRKKKDSSLVKGFEKLNEDNYSGLISAGSTGGLLASGLFISGRIEGVKRACIATSLPTFENKTLLLDTGANMDCKAEFLRDFAIMGSVFAKNVLHIDNPTVSLLNVGVEEHKGNKVSKETYALLKDTDLNFKGNIEARDLFTGKTNIVIADGFDGNIAIKTAEGIISLLSKEIKNSIYKSLKTKIGGALLKDSLKENLSKYNTDDIGGAPLLGINQYVYKAHGNSNKKAFKSAILGLIDYINTNTIEKIRGELK